MIQALDTWHTSRRSRFRARVSTKAQTTARALWPVLRAPDRHIRARFAKRCRHLHRGVHIWDYGVGITLIVSRRVP